MHYKYIQCSYVNYIDVEKIQEMLRGMGMMASNATVQEKGLMMQEGKILAYWCPLLPYPGSFIFMEIQKKSGRDLCFYL
jgi:hypothetical protein